MTIVGSFQEERRLKIEAIIQLFDKKHYQLIHVNQDSHLPENSQQKKNKKWQKRNTR